MIADRLIAAMRALARTVLILAGAALVGTEAAPLVGLGIAFVLAAVFTP